LVLCLTQLMLGYAIPWTAILLPLVLVPFVGLLIGLSWLVAATGVYVRDIAQFTGIFTSALMFLAPVFYPITAIPEVYRGWLYLNPLTFILEQARAVLIKGLVPDWLGLAAYSLVAVLVAWGGFWWFQRSRKGFADVL
jgi:lipopolysaccharide transport system permease protein